MLVLLHCFTLCLQLAANADIYVNDAFGTAHRAHASTEGVTKFLKPSVAGFLLQKVRLAGWLVHVVQLLVIYFVILKDLCWLLVGCSGFLLQKVRRSAIDI
jgi:hypothetical protein